jgi:CBS domain-containing protein
MPSGFGRRKEDGPVRISTLVAEKGDRVATISAEATVTEAIDMLRREGIGALVVSADGRHINGIISERDIVRGLSDRHASLLEQSVASIMSSTVYTCSPEDDTESLMTTMTNKRVRHVPVVTDGVLAGIVSIGDVVKARIRQLEKDRDELVDYINAR